MQRKELYVNTVQYTAVFVTTFLNSPSYIYGAILECHRLKIYWSGYILSLNL